MLITDKIKADVSILNCDLGRQLRLKTSFCPEGLFSDSSNLVLYIFVSKVEDRCMSAIQGNLIYELFNEEDLKSDISFAVTNSIKQMFDKEFNSAFKVSTGSLAVSGVDLYASVGMTNENVIGSMLICFPHKTISQILQNLYRRELPPGDPACAQGIGEITNVASAMFKDLLKKRGHAFNVALPHVTVASSFRIPGTGWVLQGNFSGPVGDFDTYLVLQPALD